MGWNESIKLTTIKPSGTLSLLAGVTAGGHPAPSGIYFKRRIRISSNSPLIEKCRQNGYHIEYQINFDGTEDKTTFVVEFPCKYPERTVTADDLSVFQQLDMVRFLQKSWSDNSVSVTAYYEKEDIPMLKEYLKKHWKEGFKTLSFLLKSGHGFIQAPFEEIIKGEYIRLSAKVKPITDGNILEEDVSGVDECAGGACPIK